MKKIVLIMIGLSTFVFADFTKNGNVVIDNITGLQWQSNTASLYMSWTEAINYCENLTLDKYSDWRLPNIKELTSIVEDTKLNPSIDTSVFNNTLFACYWSSTTYTGNNDFAWVVHFGDGNSGIYKKTSGYYVRCVRAGQ